MVTNGDYNISMLPKIAVAVDFVRPDLMNILGLSQNNILGYEGREAKVVDFRRWLYEAINIARSRPKLSLVVWDADSMSPECQSVLLKPMEELDNGISLFLITENENLLSPTILSRGVIDYLSLAKEEAETQWSEIRKCWSSGPSACIALADQLSKDQAVLAMDEVIKKLKLGLSTGVNTKRLEILDMAMTCLYELKQTNINHKLSLDNFLMSSWRLIKS